MVGTLPAEPASGPLVSVWPLLVVSETEIPSPSSWSTSSELERSETRYVA